jgi:putative NADH-flavin reductase
VRIAVFGASGAIGRAVVEAALVGGHEVVAFTRNAASFERREPGERGEPGDPRLTIVEGDARVADAVQHSLSGAEGIEAVEGVVYALGPTTNTADEVGFAQLALGNVLAAMERTGVRRLVALSGAACSMPEERKGAFDSFASRFVRLAARHVVAAKQAELDLLVASPLDWVAVRPPRVVDGPATGRYRAGPAVGIGAGSKVTRGDLAQFIVDSLSDDEYLRQAPFVVS